MEKENPIFKFKSQCKECGLIIKSNSKTQYLYNKEQHILKHKRLRLKKGKK